MNNLGLRIEFNGKQVSKAGFDKENFVLTTMSTLVNRKYGDEEFRFDVSGLDSEINIDVDWFNTELKLGDIIMIEVIQGPFDQPKLRKRILSEEEDLKQKLNYFYQLEEELKGHL